MTIEECLSCKKFMEVKAKSFLDQLLKNSPPFKAAPLRDYLYYKIDEEIDQSPNKYYTGVLEEFKQKIMDQHGDTVFYGKTKK